MQTLALAVPLHIEELRHVSPGGRVLIGRDCADEVAARGDSLMFPSKKGRTAEAFNKLARGLAVAAFQPGGVTFLGQHWEVPAPEPVRASALGPEAGGAS